MKSRLFRYVLGLHIGNLHLRQMLRHSFVLRPAVILTTTALILSSCKQPAQAPQSLTVFNAGSLTQSIDQMLRAFSGEHPLVKPAQESSGSLEAVRKITDLHKTCDVLALADYDVIPSLMIPGHADWYIAFSRNQMVLAYSPKSKFAAEINASNWYDVLLRPGVQYGHSDPNQDPAGYRTLLHWQLAERFYHQAGLYNRLQAAMPAKNIRPKSVELVALLQAGELDYIYEYRSVAEQDKLQFITFPTEIDLSDPAKAAFYAEASVDVAGNSPGEKLTIKGMPILFGLTIPKSAQNRELAEQFVEYLLSPAGQKILKDNYLITVSPPLASDLNKVPARLRSLVIQADLNTERGAVATR